MPLAEAKPGGGGLKMHFEPADITSASAPADGATESSGAAVRHFVVAS